MIGLGVVMIILTGSGSSTHFLPFRERFLIMLLAMGMVAGLLIMTTPVVWNRLSFRRSCKVFMIPVGTTRLCSSNTTFLLAHSMALRWPFLMYNDAARALMFSMGSLVVPACLVATGADAS